MSEGLGILGAGAYAREVAELVAPSRVAFFAVDAPYLEPGRDELVDIATLDPSLLASEVVAAVGPPGLRRSLVDAWHGDRYARIVATSASVSPSAQVGAGCVIMPLAAISTGASLGRHVSLNLGATVSHDCVLGDYVTLAPGVHIAGGCTLGAGVFVGIGAVVANGVSIASGAVVGAGAVVVEDIVEAGVYFGVPCRKARDQREWLREL